MALTTFSGLGSGIDFNTIRDAILAQRALPISQMQSKAGSYNNRIEALKQLNASLAALTSSAQSLTNRDLGTGRNAATGDSSIATATATADASLGSFDINVSRIATSLTQASRSYSSKTAPILADGATTATFQLRKGGADSGIEIAIDSTNNTLSGLRDAINAKNAGVTATIVDVAGDGNSQQLVLSSKEVGTNKRIELVETSATGTGANMDLRSLNPPDGDLTKLDASLTINGLQLTRSSNNISDAVSGVSLTVKKVGAVSVNVTQSTDLDSKLRGFINAYNNIQDFVSEQYKKDAKSRPTGVLAGDPALRSVQQQLREVMNSVSEDNGGSFTALSQIGVNTTAEGRLELDSTIFNESIKSNSEDVRALLFGKTTNEKGIFQNASAVMNGLSDTLNGSVQTAINGYESSVKTLSDSITNRLASLNRLRDTLTKQFAAADAAIGQLNGQGTALTSIIKSLEPKDR